MKIGDNMKGIIKKAKRNKKLALAIIGQAILDEADIGLCSITISYVSKETAKYLWDIANYWKLANKFRKFKDAEGRYDKWGFSIKAEKRKEIYNAIKPLPDPDRDRAFRHLIGRNLEGEPLKSRGQSKMQIILELLHNGPMTTRNIMYNVGIGYATLKGHLRDLKSIGLVKITGKNIDDLRHKNMRQANLWGIADKNKVRLFIQTGSFG